VTDAPKGLPVSVQVRLVQHAKATGIDPNVVLARFAAERFLYRLSCSSYADRFLLKGALLMLVWLGETIRPTRDADLLGFGEISQESLAKIFTDVYKVDVEPDGLEHLSSSIGIAPIRQEDAYSGLRATIQASDAAAEPFRTNGHFSRRIGAAAHSGDEYNRDLPAEGFDRAR